MKYLANHGIKLTHKIRLIIGTDAENGWRDLPTIHFRQEGRSTMGFSPDQGRFPGYVNGEKAFQTVQYPFRVRNLATIFCVSFIAGNASDVVPGDARARVVVPDPDEMVHDFEQCGNIILSGKTEIKGQELRLLLNGFRPTALTHRW